MLGNDQRERPGREWGLFTTSEFSPLRLSKLPPFGGIPLSSTKRPVTKSRSPNNLALSQVVRHSPPATIDKHHGTEDPRPNPIKPHPQEPVCGEVAKPTGVLVPEDAHLMSRGNELEVQGRRLPTIAAKRGQKEPCHARIAAAVQISEGF